MENAMSPVSKIAGNRLLTVGQKVKVVLFYAPNGNRKEPDATACIMGNGRTGRTSQHVF
jgi:hypothetical protein